MMVGPSISSPYYWARVTRVTRMDKWSDRPTETETEIDEFSRRGFALELTLKLAWKSGNICIERRLTKFEFMQNLNRMNVTR